MNFNLPISVNMNSLVLFSALFGLSLASSYPPYMDMADMYRMQLLADAWGVEDYLPEAETQLMDSPVDSRSQVVSQTNKQSNKQTNKQTK